MLREYGADWGCSDFPPPSRHDFLLAARTAKPTAPGPDGILGCGGVERAGDTPRGVLADVQRPSPGMGTSLPVLIPKGADEGNYDEPLCGAVACRPLVLRNSDAKVLGSVVNRQHRRARC